MKPMDYVKLRGIIVCFEECGNNLRSLKAMIKRECPETTIGQWNYFQRKCKQFLSENVHSKKKDIIEKFIQIFSSEIE